MNGHPRIHQRRLWTKAALEILDRLLLEWRSVKNWVELLESAVDADESCDDEIESRESIDRAHSYSGKLSLTVCLPSRLPRTQSTAGAISLFSSPNMLFSISLTPSFPILHSPNPPPREHSRKLYLSRPSIIRNAESSIGLENTAAPSIS